MFHIIQGVSGKESYTKGLYYNTTKTLSWGHKLDKEAKSGPDPCVLL